MKKIIEFIWLVTSIIVITGCGVLFDSAVDPLYQNTEIDYFEEIEHEQIEIVVGTNELPNFDSYVNRVSPDDTIQPKSSFDIDTSDLDTTTVGEYTILYTFMSLDTLVEHEISVRVVSRPREEVIASNIFETTPRTITVTVELVDSEYVIDIDKIEIFSSSSDTLIEREINPSVLENII
ncbi:MAG: hypothetical protein K9L64_07130, partial [Candidatus Izimaplasma sp.]|nr:hypothetical protein [Candidatus Izimaplasma bacterium]